MEKRDGEEMARLRSRHETEMLSLVRLVKKSQIEEAKAALDGLQKYRVVVEARRSFFAGRNRLSSRELSQIKNLETALLLHQVQAGLMDLAAILRLLPEFKIGTPFTIGSTFGGANVSDGLEKAAGIVSTHIGIASTQSSIDATQAGYDRRLEEWKHQADLATKELQQVDRQILGAQIRMAIAEKDLSNHDRQTEQAKEVADFLRDKFTSQQLYQWMVGQLSGLYFQSYQLAYDLAKRAEKAYQHETGDFGSSFVRFGHWDGLRQGLLAGEKLHLDLKRMEIAYLDKNRRELEITKHISLAAGDPAELMKLRAGGECTIRLPEALFDEAYPGHYMRRIRSVSISIPCVAGPYSGVNSRLALLRSQLRVKPELGSGGYARKPGEDARFRDAYPSGECIVTSTGSSDGGGAEAEDGRYRAFEGYGVISDWRLELSQKDNSFDVSTVSDVILHIRYTARDGGEVLRQKAREAVPRTRWRLFSLRHEFPGEWNKMSTTGELRLDFERKLPFGASGVLKEMTLFMDISGNPTLKHGETTFTVKGENSIWQWKGLGESSGQATEWVIGSLPKDAKNGFLVLTLG